MTPLDKDAHILNLEGRNQYLTRSNAAYRDECRDLRTRVKAWRALGVVGWLCFVVMVVVRAMQ